MRSLLLLLLTIAPVWGQESRDVLIVKPDAFPTLVNPNCSHCMDEAKRRGQELRADDAVLCWIRGYSEGGAIPVRFFLNHYRVISDSYGVFVHDPDAGFVRGFAPSFQFRFHGWRNGIMVLKHEDGTLFSALSGVAFAGPRKGERLPPVPTLASRWGDWLKRYPQAVAYHMFPRYQPVESATTLNKDSLKSRGATDQRLEAETPVLGVWTGQTARAYRLSTLREKGNLIDQVEKEALIITWHAETQSASAFRPLASQPRKFQAPAPDARGISPPNPGTPLPPGSRALPVEKLTFIVREGRLVDQESQSIWDHTGRAIEGPKKGWTLEWVDSVQVKWFAWAKEYPQTTVHALSADTAPASKPVEQKEREIAGTAEYLRNVPKHFARLEAIDAKRRQVTLLLEGEKLAKTWPLTEEAELKVHGWWGRLEDFTLGDRVWVWFQLDRRKRPTSILMLADEISEQDIHGEGLTVVDTSADKVTFKPVSGANRTLRLDPKALEKIAHLSPKAQVFVQSEADRARLVLQPAELEAKRQRQREVLTERWKEHGLPGTVSLVHLSGEVVLLLDHEAMRWGRSLQPGDKVSLVDDPPISAVVREVQPWRERTQVRLVINGVDLADLKVGQRRHLKMTTPSSEVQQGALPPDVDRKRSTEQRIEWFLANIYCTCPVKGDICTGMFYTLASCNPNGCGMPNAMRLNLRRKMERGLSDRQIFEEMMTTYGPLLTRPHLLR